MPTEILPPLLTEEDLRHIAHWAAVCAHRALPIFEAKAPHDTRPREALSAVGTFVEGSPRTAALRKLAWAANASASKVGDPAAAAAARAAATAAGSAFTHPLATPHQLKHVLAPAAYAARAAMLAALDPAGILEKELCLAIAQARQEIRQIVRRMPAPVPSKGEFQTLLYRLDKGLRL